MLYFVCVVPCVRVFVCASSSYTTVVLRKHAIYATVGHAQAIARRADARSARGVLGARRRRPAAYPTLMSLATTPSLPATALAASASIGGNGGKQCSRPRRIYIDMGVNWCNTLQLFRDLPEAWLPQGLGTHHSLAQGPAPPWQVYGFEASPLIVPYANQCALALSAGRPLPRSPVPPFGSGPDLLKVAAQYNCSHFGNYAPGAARQKAVKNKLACIFERVRRDLRNLAPDAGLSSNPQLLHERAASAARCATGHADEYTMIPAAVSTTDGTMDIFGSLEDLITGGVKSVKMPGYHRGKVERSVVPTVNVVRWLVESFRPDDFVVVKMDVEGAEHAIVPALIKAGGAPLIDVFLWECHSAASRATKCRHHEKALEQAGVNVVYREPFKFTGAGHEKRTKKKTVQARGLVASRSTSQATVPG